MRVKPILFAALVLLPAAYAGGSYYVGQRADEHVRDMIAQAQAQSQGQLVFSPVNAQGGLFRSSGEFVMTMPKLRLAQGPTEINVQYRINHALHGSRAASFDWSMTPQTALAAALSDVYPETPSLSGQGEIDWTGGASSSIGFPGVDRAAFDGQRLTMQALTGRLQVAANAFDLSMNIPSIEWQADAAAMGQPAAETFTVDNLAYQARSSDTSGGSVRLVLMADRFQRLHARQWPAEVADFRWQVDVGVSENVLSFDTVQTAASVMAGGSAIDNVDISFGMDGLHRDDLSAMGDWLDSVEGDFNDMSEAQANEIQMLLLEMLARGVTLRVPAIKGDMRINGDPTPQTIGLEGLSLSAQVLDTNTGAGRVSAALQSLAVPVMFQPFLPALEGLRLEASNEVVDGRSDIRIKHELAHYQQQDQVAQDVKFDFQLTGLTPEQLAVVVDILRQAQGDFQRLSAADRLRLREVLYDAALHGLRLSIPVAQATVGRDASSRNTVALEGFDVQAKLEDPATGAGQASLALAKLDAEGPDVGDVPQIAAFKLTVDNRVNNQLLNHQAMISLQSLQTERLTLGESSLSMILSGVKATDMQRLSVLVQSMRDGLNDQQQAELAQIAERAIRSGFEWKIPALDVKIDAAQVQANASLILDGLGQAPLAAFNVGRLAQMQAKVDVAGQTPALDGMLTQGQAMGFLVKGGQDDQDLRGQVVFKDGQFVINGVAVPAQEYILVANLMVLSALASSTAPPPDAAPAARPRRGQD